MNSPEDLSVFNRARDNLKKRIDKPHAGGEESLRNDLIAGYSALDSAIRMLDTLGIKLNNARLGGLKGPPPFLTLDIFFDGKGDEEIGVERVESPLGTEIDFDVDWREVEGKEILRIEHVRP